MGANQSVEALQNDLQDEVNGIKTELQVRSMATSTHAYRYLNFSVRLGVP